MMKTLHRRTVFVLDGNETGAGATLRLLESMRYEYEVFAIADTAIDRLKLLDERVASVLLIDSGTPSINGLDVHERLKAIGVAIPFIFTSAHGDVAMAVAAMAKGAITFLEKPLNEFALSRALTIAFSHSVQLRRSVRADHHELVRTRARLGSLTHREAQIVQGLLADLSNQQIAGEFNISIKTVELYRSKVMNKLEAKNAAHLVRMVMSCAPN